MALLIKVMNKVKTLLIKFKLRKKVIIEKGVFIDQDSNFEGGTRLARNSSLYKCSFGFGTYIGRDTNIECTSLGRYTCIGPRVQTVLGGHPLNNVSMHPAFYSLRKQAGFTYSQFDKIQEFRYADIEKKYSIVIGSDVWIAADCKIIEGVRIYDGAAILAGAVVTNDVPPYAVVGGVPAKIIRYRFKIEDIDYLLKLKWWEKDQIWIKEHAKYFENIDLLKEKLETKDI